jgi:hypothetical protein
MTMYDERKGGRGRMACSEGDGDSLKVGTMKRLTEDVVVVTW